MKHTTRTSPLSGAAGTARVEGGLGPAPVLTTPKGKRSVGRLGAPDLRPGDGGDGARLRQLGRGLGGQERLATVPARLGGADGHVPEERVGGLQRQARRPSPRSRSYPAPGVPALSQCLTLSVARCRCETLTWVTVLLLSNLGTFVIRIRIRVHLYRACLVHVFCM